MSLCISSSFVAEPLNSSLAFWLNRLNYHQEIEVAPYNQIFQTLLDPQSIFARNLGGINIVLLRWQDLGAPSNLELNAKSLIESLVGLRSASPLLVVSCKCSPDFLSLAGSLCDRLDSLLMYVAKAHSSLHTIMWREIERLYPVRYYYSPASDRIGNIPYTDLYFTAIGIATFRRIDSLLRSPAKVIVIDLDNTLWGGVVGEVGPDHIVIDAPRLAFQQLLLEQRANGKLLAIASKNNEADAQEAFQRPEMLLPFGYFAAHRINWRAKCRNIIELSETLSLGLDSFVFLDDSPKEIAEIEANLPQVRTLLIPQNPQDIPEMLAHFWPFDQPKVTREDLLRNESYQQESARQDLIATARTLDDFVANLELQVAIEPLQPELIPRVAQLTLRTNQFNTTTIRRSESELQALIDSGSLSCITVAAKDRFGDYGNVGAVLYSVDPDELNVESFFLSCRALGRGIEHLIVQRLGSIAQTHDSAELSFHFFPSTKNLPARQFLESLCASRVHLNSREEFRMKADDAANLTYRPAAYDKPPQRTPASGGSISQSGASYRWICSQTRNLAQLQEIIAGRAESSLLVPAETELGKSQEDAPPTDDYEAALCEMWSDVLRLQRIGIHDNFFEYGGDSFLAVKVLSKVLQRWPYHQLTIAVFLEAPTIAEFAAVIRSGKKIMTQCLVPFRESGTNYPFFCIPGAGGNVVSLRVFGRGFSEDQPLYCIQAKGLDGGEPCGKVEEHALHYLHQIRGVQPEGPYHLGGVCFGGLVAFELARLLQELGEPVALVALLDTYNPAFARTLSKPRLFQVHMSFYLRRGLLHLQNLSRISWRKRWEYVNDKVGALLRHLSDFSLLRTHRNTAFVPAFTEADAEYCGFLKETLDRVGQASTLAASHYVPKYYEGKIMVFAASDRFIEPYDDDALGWRPFAKDVEVITLPGTHSFFLTGQGRDIAVSHIEKVTAARCNVEADLWMSEVQG